MSQEKQYWFLHGCTQQAISNLALKRVFFVVFFCSVFCMFSPFLSLFLSRQIVWRDNFMENNSWLVVIGWTFRKRKTEQFLTKKMRNILDRKIEWLSLFFMFFSMMLDECLSFYLIFVFIREFYDNLLFKKLVFMSKSWNRKNLFKK